MDKQFLVFGDEATAQTRNREIMDAGRDPNNTGGDGKPYVTTGRYAMRVASDGQAVLEVDDVAPLTATEKQKLLAQRPVKFDPSDASEIADERI